MVTRISKVSSGYKAGIVAGFMGFMILAATQASAQTVGPDVVVRYADLNISTAAGAEKLYERIRLAAAEVCPPANRFDVVRYRMYLSCQDAAVAHAVGSISSPQLAAVYAARTHHAVRSAA